MPVIFIFSTAASAKLSFFRVGAKNMITSLAEQSGIKYSPLVFILGAGASKSANVPAFEDCWKKMDNIFGFTRKNGPKIPVPDRALKQLYCAVDELSGKKDFEALCGNLRRKSKSLLQESQKSLTLSGKLDIARACVEAEYAIRKVFVDLIDVEFGRVHALIGKYQPMFNLLPGTEAPDIFTLNNDLLVEWLAERLGLHLIDGFNRDRNLDNKNSWSCYHEPRASIRLYKLHGSINWYRHDSGTISKWSAPRTVSSLLSRKSSASIVPNLPLVWPGVYDEWDEMTHLREQFFKPALQQARCVIIAGYKMGDPEIYNCVIAALKSWPRPTGRRVFIVCGGNPYEDGLMDLVRDLNCDLHKPVICTNEGDCYSGGYFPDILENTRFLTEMQAALSGES